MTRALTVTKLARDVRDGFWRARVSVNGTTADCDRKFGSWMMVERAAPHARDFVRRDVLPHIAAELQKHVRRLERQEKA